MKYRVNLEVELDIEADNEDQAEKNAIELLDSFLPDILDIEVQWIEEIFKYEEDYEKQQELFEG